MEKAEMWYGGDHIWELPGNCTVLTMVMVICHYIERIWRIPAIPIFLYNIYDNKKYYPGDPGNILIQSIINII